MNILIVEDDENSRIYLERALKSQNYTVESVANGALALEKAIQAPPDIIISDILMPVMDGFDLCRKVKADKRLHRIPFIFYTATFTDEKDRQLAVSLGASRFIVKPVEMEDFFKTIEEVIEEYKEKKLIVPEQTADKEKIEEMYSQAIARKLEKKVEELKESERSLREKNQWLVAVIESIGDAVIATDPEGKIRLMNPIAEALTGWKQEDALGKTLAGVFNIISEGGKLIEDPVKKAIREDVFYGLADHTVLITKEGMKIPIDIIGSTIKIDGNSIIGIVLIFYDVFERIRNYEAMKISERK
jgi:PAS domain S-box-containing protein